MFGKFISDNDEFICSKTKNNLVCLILALMKKSTIGKFLFFLSFEHEKKKLMDCTHLHKTRKDFKIKSRLYV